MIAHELGHVKNRDTLLMTVTATIAGAISMLANFGFMFGGRSNSNNNIGFIGTLALLILGPLAAGLVQMAISRNARIRGRPGGRRDQPASLVARVRPAEDRRRRPAHPQYAGRA